MRSNEPLIFIQTDANFIADHNDVFNANVAAYLAAIVAEARYKLLMKAKKDPSRPEVEDTRLPVECRSDNFGPCFELYHDRFKKLREQDVQ